MSYCILAARNVDDCVHDAVDHSPQQREEKQKDPQLIELYAWVALAQDSGRHRRWSRITCEERMLAASEWCLPPFHD